MAKTEKKTEQPTDKIVAYCVKTKKKENMVDATIVKTARGGFMAKGVTKDGNKMVAILSEAVANALIKNKVAKKGF